MPYARNLHLAPYLTPSCTLPYPLLHPTLCAKPTPCTLPCTLPYHILHPIGLPELTRTSLRANQRCRKSRWMKLRCVFTTHMSLLLICLYYSYDIASQRCRKSKWMKLRCVFTTHMSLLLIWQRQSTLSKVQMNEAKVCYDVYVHICTMYNFYLYVHIYRAGGETRRASTIKGI